MPARMSQITSDAGGGDRPAAPREVAQWQLSTSSPISQVQQPEIHLGIRTKEQRSQV